MKSRSQDCMKLNSKNIKFLLIFIVAMFFLNSCKQLIFLSPDGKETLRITEGTSGLTRNNPFYNEYGLAKSPPY